LLYSFSTNNIDAAYSSIDSSIKPILRSLSIVSFSSCRYASRVRYNGSFPSKGFFSSRTISLFSWLGGSLVDAFFKKKPSRYASLYSNFSRTKRTCSGSSSFRNRIRLLLNVFYLAKVIALMLIIESGLVSNRIAILGIVCIFQRSCRGSDLICI